MKQHKTIVAFCGLMLVLFGLLWVHVGGISGFKNLNQKIVYHDWDFFTGVDAMAQKSFQALQFPLWAPYMCGGVPLWADSQIGAVSPFSILLLLFGPIRDMRILFLLVPIIGGINMYLLLRSYKCSYLASYIGSIVFAFGGALMPRLSVGHVNFVQIIWVPLVLFFINKSFEQSWVYTFGASFVMTIILLCGGNYIFIICSVMIAAYCVAESLTKLQVKPLFFLMLILATTAGLTAIKWIPTLEYAKFASFHIMKSTEQISTQLLWDGLVQSTENHTFPCSGLACPHEYVGYIGWITVIMILITVQYIEEKKKAITIIFCAILLTLFARGAFHSLAPWNIVHELPIFKSMRIPSRFFSFVPMLLTIVLSLGISGTETRIREKKRIMISNSNSNDDKFWATTKFLISYGALACIGVLLVVDIMGAAKPYSKLFTLDKIHLPNYPTFQQTTTQATDTAPATITAPAIGNFGIKYCYNPSAENIPHYVSTPDEPLDFFHGQEYALLDNNADFTLDKWTPNKITLTVNTPQETRLIVNQNYAPGWKTTQGWNVVPWNPETKENGEKYGLMSVIVPEGKHRIQLYYLPNSFILGTLISTLTMIIVLTISYIFCKWQNRTSTTLVSNSSNTSK